MPLEAYKALLLLYLSDTYEMRHANYNSFITITSWGAHSAVPVLKLHNFRHYLYRASSFNPDPTANFTQFNFPAFLMSQVSALIPN